MHPFFDGFMSENVCLCGFRSDAEPVFANSEKSVQTVLHFMPEHGILCRDGVYNIEKIFDHCDSNAVRCVQRKGGSRRGSVHAFSCPDRSGADAGSGDGPV
jgi:hypothetical protein